MGCWKGAMRGDDGVMRGSDGVTEGGDGGDGRK